MVLNELPTKIAKQQHHRDNNNNIIIILNLIYIAQFDTNGSLAALCIVIKYIIIKVV